MKKTNSAVIVLFVFLLGACTSNKISPENYSGYLDDYSILHPAKKDKDTLVFVAEDVSWGRYENLIIDEVVIITPDKQKHNKSELLKQIATSFKQKLTFHLSREFNIVEQPVGHTLRLQAAITSVYENYDDLRGYQYIPIAAAITGAMRVVGAEKQKARMMSEGRLLDASTNALLAQAIDLKTGKIIQKEGEAVILGDLDPVLDLWAKRLTEKIFEVQHQYIMR